MKRGQVGDRVHYEGMPRFHGTVTEADKTFATVDWDIKDKVHERVSWRFLFPVVRHDA